MLIASSRSTPSLPFFPSFGFGAGQCQRLQLRLTSRMEKEEKRKMMSGAMTSEREREGGREGERSTWQKHAMTQGESLILILLFFFFCPGKMINSLVGKFRARA